MNEATKLPASRTPGNDVETQQAETGIMQFKFKIYRDSDTWRLRKVVVQIHHALHMQPLPCDRTRMFAWPKRTFADRLKRRMEKMAARARTMVLLSECVVKVEMK